MEWLNTILRNARGFTPGSLDYSEEELAELKWVAPAKNAQALTKNPKFGPVTFSIEDPTNPETELPLLRHLPPPKALAGRRKQAWVCALRFGVQIPDGFQNMGPSVLYAFLAHVGPVPRIIGAYRLYMVGKRPYVVYWVPACLSWTRQGTLCYLCADGKSEIHETLRREAFALISETTK